MNVDPTPEAAHALMRVDDRIEAALAAARAATWEWDPVTDALRTSAGIHALYGLAPGQGVATGADVSRLVHPEDRDGRRVRMEATVHAHGSSRHEFRLVRPVDGVTVWLEERAQSLCDTGGFEMVGLVWDITERTRELAQVNQSLREQVAQRRSAQLARRDLLRQLVSAQEQERRRISRELHDELGQRMSALTLKLAMLRKAQEEGPVRTELEALEKIAFETENGLDFLVWQLRPTALDDLGLVAALDDHVHEWSSHFGIEAHLRARRDEAVRLDPEIETVLYRVAQEALNNVAKHANARRVELRLERGASHVSLEIHDDGAGFETGAAIAPKGLGLVGMRERAMLIGGELVVASAPGGGTSVKVRIPLRLSP